MQSIVVITRLATFVLPLFVSCNNNTSSQNNSDAATNNNTTPLINYSLSAKFPHDTTSFTEGLLLHDGKLYESTGSPEDLPQTKSVFGPVNLKTGVIDTKAELDKKKYFGEGIVFLNDKVYQLTYKSKAGFVYDAKTFKKIGEFSFPSKEGWGLTTDGSSLIMSDGTSLITYLQPGSFKTTRSITVTDENGAVAKVNELEFIEGFLFANVYNTNSIIKIDTATGNVLGKLDLGSLANEAKVKYPASLEMNGIAYDSTIGKMYVTGKMWPHIFQIDFSH